MLPKGSRPGFGPKRAVSQWSQKGILIAGPKAFKRQKFASKRLHASPSQELSFLGTSRYVSAAFQNRKFPGPKTEVISIPKNAGLMGAGAKSRPLAFRSPGNIESKRALCAKLPAPRYRGSPGANQRFGPKRVFVPAWRKASKRSVDIESRRALCQATCAPGQG